MAVDPQVRRILDLLENLRGLKPLRELFWTELNYERAAIPLSVRAWPEARQGLLAEDPALFATAGAGGEFHVIYCRLAGDRLSLTAERQVISLLLQQHPYALFVFSNQAQDSWHFVNVKVAVPRDAEENRDAGRRRLFRRITVAPGELLRTAAEQLATVDVERVEGGERASALALQQRHDDAFDVDKVTRRFYTTYREVFQDVEHAIGAASGGAFDTDADSRRLFTQRLFNRLMFVAFVQKKGWLTFGGSSDYLRALWNDYRRYAKAEPDEDYNFYRDRLQLLFFSALSNEVDVAGINGGGFLKELLGETVYLNGGLFEKDRMDEDDRVEVPDAAVRRILDDLFGAFNFTVSEATPLDVEVAVDPEMLGKVFEELVTGRHETGSYYTPKPIVAFMCREALKGYLQAAVPQESPAQIARFVDEHAADGLRNGEAVLQALREVKACDPACGSGAYLLGMLHELLDLREALFATGKLDYASIYARKLEIIQNNLYGVDIDLFAVNVARLRLWLSLVVDFEREDPAEPIPPLPNLDFKIEQGDSLAAPMEKQYDLADHMVHDFEEAKAEYMRAYQGHKRLARAEVERLRREIAGWTHGGAKVAGFDWMVEFAEVFATKHAPATIGGDLNLGHELAADRPGGFDIVLANPPYVRMELFKDQKPTLRRNFSDVHSDRADLYVYFYARAMDLLAPAGMLVFISSNKWFRAGYGAKLRKYISDNMWIGSITDFGDLPVFETATAYPMIFVAQNGHFKKSLKAPIFTHPRSLESPYPDVRALVDQMGTPLPIEALQGEEWRFANDGMAAMLTRMRTGSKPLVDVVRNGILYGIKTGLNEAFIIDGVTRDALISADPNSAEVIKPVALGKEIRRWWFDSPNKWILYLPHGIDASKYPAVLDYLRPFKLRLEQRATKQRWYELQQPQQRYERGFQQMKFLVPDIAKEPRFALDRHGTYPANTAYGIVSDDLYLLGALNSSSVAAYYSETSSQVRGGYMRFIYQYIAKIPIPEATPADRAVVAELVQHCLDAGGKGPGVAQWEAEIDERVAFLYGLKAPASAA